MRHVAHTELNVIKSNIQQDLSQTFKGERLRVACKANDIMHDVLTQPPIGWNVGTTRAEYYVACEQAVMERYKYENPPGFLGTLFFGAVISGVISWLVKRWLDDIFPRES
jgi:hypothetical protein